MKLSLPPTPFFYSSPKAKRQEEERRGDEVAGPLTSRTGTSEGRTRQARQVGSLRRVYYSLASISRVNATRRGSRATGSPKTVRRRCGTGSKCIECSAGHLFVTPHIFYELNEQNEEDDEEE